MSERIHEGLEYVVIFHLVHALQVARVALQQYFSSLFPGLVGKREVQDVVLDPSAPEFVEFFRRCGPR